MGYHQHFRAVPPTELVVEPGWLADHMAAAWERRAAECAAGVAHVIDKDFDFHARLYTGGLPADDDPSDVRTLPVYGGTVVFPEDGNPPFAVLTPAQVGRTASYLAEADFDALWAAAAEQIRVVHWDVAEDRAYRLSQHRELAAFYARAAAAGHAVVKAFRF
ncbi:DUF1877 family protein [Kitasatospora sp. NPDC004531]